MTSTVNIISSEDMECPIGFCTYENPVVAEDGNIYEMSCIQEWFKKCGKKITSPVSQEPMGTVLISCRFFNNLHKVYCDANKIPYKPKKPGLVSGGVKQPVIPVVTEVDQLIDLDNGWQEVIQRIINPIPINHQPLPQPVPVPDIGITPDWNISFGDKTFITQNLSASKIKFVQERRFDKLTISEIEKFCMLNGIRLPRKNSLKDDYVKIMIKTFSQNN
jgi:hypothetical protein